MKKTKICSTCKENKILPDCFYRNPTTRDGYRNHCKKCERERERNYRRKYLARKRATDPEYCKWKAKQDRKYRQSLKGKISTIRAKTKRRARSDKWRVTPKQWKHILKAFGHKCAYCGRPDDLTADHFISLYHGGQSIIGNIVPACLSCNSSKQHKMPQEWCSETQLQRVLDILLSL